MAAEVVSSNGGDEVLVFYEDEDNLKKLCNFLRSNEGPAVREAIEMEKRVYYLKGECHHYFCVCKMTLCIQEKHLGIPSYSPCSLVSIYR